MNVVCVGTGSSGNCYAIQRNNGRILLLECGLPLKKIFAGLKQNGMHPDQIDAVLVSHCHKDHSLTRSKFQEFTETFNEWETGYPVQVAEGVVVKPFWIEHDVENYGFVIEADGKRVLYATDFSYIPLEYTFTKKLDLALVECNWNERGIKNSPRPDVQKERARKNHSSDINTWEFLNRLQYDRALLIHMSAENLDRDHVKAMVSASFIELNHIYVV